MIAPAIQTKRDRLAWRVHAARELLDAAAGLAFKPQSKPSVRRQRLRDYENAQKYLAEHEAALAQYDAENRPAGVQGLEQ